jgi:carboxypeptidase Q
MGESLAAALLLNWRMPKHLIHLLAALVCVVSAGAQQAPPADQANLIKVGGQLLVAGKAYEYDRQLADEIGPRLTGSANYVKATDWAAAEFTRMGLVNVHKEPWDIPATWEPETVATARILAPHEQRLHLESEGWSPSTPPGGVRGHVFWLKTLTPEAVKADATRIKDSIVLLDETTVMGEENSPLLFGQVFDALHMIGVEGAKAIIFGLGATNNVPSPIGNTAFKGTVDALPSGNLGLEDTLLLRRLLDAGPVEVEFSFKNRIREHVAVNNVVAEIPGSDSSGEFVVVGGHLDSWHLGTGAQDNGTGAASVMAIAQAVKASGVTPRRTMRFVLFGGEEEGLLGSVHYVRDHVAEMGKCAGVFVTDTGGDTPKGWYIFGREDEKQALAPIHPLLTSLGAGETTDEGKFTFQTDEGPFLVHGVPSFVLWTEMTKYELLHHKPSDTFDKVNQRDLNLGVAVVGMTAYAFADAPAALNQLTNAQMEEQLKKIKALAQYQDMIAHNLF